jgi:hypothetical protein
MSNTSGVTVGKDSTDTIDILGSVKEPAVQTIQSGHKELTTTKSGAGFTTVMR